MISNALSNAYNVLYEVIPWVVSAIFGALWEVLVVFGVHWSFTPITLMNYDNFGFDTLQVCKCIAVCAQVAACFGVFWKSKNSEVKSVAASSAATGVFGITEPAIYGVTLRFKKPFICGLTGSAIGCAVAALFNARFFVYSGLPGILALPNAIFTDAAKEKLISLGNTTDYSNSLMGVAIGIVIAVVVTFILVQVIGFDDPASAPKSDEPEKMASPADSGLPFTVCAPLNGTAAALSDIPDDTFSAGVLGQGAAIIPSDGKLYAPFDGVVSLVVDTKHAISLDGPGGCEMLIHVGLETVSLNGKYFSPKVKDGDKVKKGDLLMEFDLQAISRNFKTITPILVTNIEDLGEIVPLKASGTVKAGDPLYEVR